MSLEVVFGFLSGLAAHRDVVSCGTDWRNSPRLALDDLVNLEDLWCA